MTIFPRRGTRLALALLACLVITPAGFADPLHQFGKQDAFWHHGSGWVFPRHVGGFELEGSPSQLDGNEDVTSTYAMESNGSRRTAVVDIYYPTSAAAGAKLVTARAAVQAAANAGSCKATSQSEQRFALDRQPKIVGTRVTFAPAKVQGCSRSDLFFFQTANWVITARSTALAGDAGAAKAFEAFVRALRWDTLDTDPLLHDPSP